MGVFKSIGRGIKRGWRGITGQTAAKEVRRAGETQAQAIQRGYALQRAELPQAISDITRAGEAAEVYMQPYRKAGYGGIMGARELLEAGPPPEAAYTPTAYEAPTAAEVSASPAVQFRMEQAQRAMERSASARGGLLGGGHQRQLARYMQGLASQEYESEAVRRFREAQLAEQQAQFAPQFAQQQYAQQLGGLQTLGELGLEAAGQTAGIRERLGGQLAGIRTGSGAAAAAALQSAGQARASGALAGAQARQQAMSNIMRLGGQLGAAYATGGTSLAMPGGGAYG